MGIITGYSRRTASILPSGGGGASVNIFNSDGTATDNLRRYYTKTNSSASSLQIRNADDKSIMNLYGSLVAEFGVIGSAVDFTSVMNNFRVYEPTGKNIFSATSTGVFTLGSTTQYTELSMYMNPASPDKFKIYRGSSDFLTLNANGYLVYLAGPSSKYISLNGGDARINVSGVNAGYYGFDNLGNQLIQADIQGGTAFFNLKNPSANKVQFYAGVGGFFADALTFGSTSYASASCQIDVQSTSKGLGLPSMTTAQKTAIGSPRTGLMVYDNTLNLVSYYNGITWVNI